VLELHTVFVCVFANFFFISNNLIPEFAFGQGLPDFSRYNKPKWEKYAEMVTKIPNDHTGKIPKWQ
jgi:hypothetical protein